MKKRILSLLLVAAMLLAMFPTAFAAEHGITVTAPKGVSVTAGALYELELAEMFEDTENHTLSYSLKEDYGDKIYIKNEKLEFTTPTAGDYTIVITASCTGGLSVEGSVKITVTAAAAGDPIQYGYDETDKDEVTVRVSISNDGVPIVGNDKGATVLGSMDVTIPYFSLESYGLEQFNRYHTEDGQGAYVDEVLVKRPTLLHLYIYMLERYYLGLSEDKCGKGNAVSHVLEYAGTGDGVYDLLGGKYEDTMKALNITGSATSLYMQQFWGHDENLMYYRNHVYPLMGPGWGSTADYILLSDGDVIDLAMFSDWNFWTKGAFACFDKDGYTIKQNGTLNFQTLKYDTQSVGQGGSEKTEPIQGLTAALYTSTWAQAPGVNQPVADSADSSKFACSLSGLPAGTYYLLAMDPNAGSESSCYAPAVTKVTVEEGDPYEGCSFVKLVCDTTDQPLTKFTSGTCYVQHYSNPGDKPYYVVTIPDGTHGIKKAATVDVYYPADTDLVSYCALFDPDTGEVDWSFTAGSDYEYSIREEDGYKIAAIPAAFLIENKLALAVEDSSYDYPDTFSFVYGDIDNTPAPSVAVTGVSLDKTTLTLDRRQSVQLTATVEPADALNKNLTWESLNPEIVSVKDGLVTGLKAGEGVVQVTTKDGGFTARCTVTVTDSSMPQQDENGVYQIANAAQLKWFADQVNDGGDENAALNAVLTQDIDLSSVCGEGKGSWTPIGDHSKDSYTKYVTYSGKFDGQGHKITNLYISEKNDDYTSVSWNYRALFGDCRKATIENLFVYGTVESNNRFVAAIVGSATACTLRNLHNYATVTCTQATNEWGYAGVVASPRTNTLVENCSNHGKISGHCYQVGGIAASAAGVTFKGCYNDAEIYCHNTPIRDDEQGVGGIVGYTYNGVTLENCYNTGKVWHYFQTQARALCVGGLVGLHYSGELTLTNCYNAGLVTTSSACLEKANIGGLVGYMRTNGTVSAANALYLDSTAAKDAAGGTAVTAAALTAADLGEGFQSSCPYPVLSWQTPVAHTDANNDYVCDVCGAKLPAPAYLSVLRLSKSGTASNPGDYIFTPAFDGTAGTYQVRIPDADGTGAYLWATLSENAPEGSAIQAVWTNLGNNQSRNTSITSGKASGQTLLNFSKGGKANTVTVTVGVEGDAQTYILTSYRTPTLKGLSLEGVRMNETFSYSSASYTATTTLDTVTVTAAPYDEGYTVTYNGGTSNVIALNDGENVITVKVANADGDAKEYTVTVKKVPLCIVTFKTTPADAAVFMVDSFGETVYSDAEGRYALMEGASYTYNVTAKGYVGVRNTMEAKAGEIKVALTAAAKNDKIDENLPAEWPNFRNGNDHLGLVNALTPTSDADCELLWAVKYGTGWAAAPGSPILVDGDLITYTGNTIKRLDVNTGKVLAEGTMAGTSSFSINPATYANGMIFVGLSGGKIQAFNAKTLESLWIYTDPIGGQPNTSPTYYDGYIYVGFWNGENRPGNFVALSVTDEDPSQTEEAKLATWSYGCNGGFYWAGAYVTDKLCIVGTDDGSGEGNYVNTSALLVFDRASGKILDSHYGCSGDIRSNVSHDPDSDRVFFTSKGGYIYNAKIDWNTGKITDFKSLALKDAEGYTSEQKPGAIMSTCTPSVYNGRIYLGVSGNKGQFTKNGGHCIEVINLDVETGEMSYAYSYGIVGYPQTSAMVSTAYQDKDFDGDGQADGYVFIYLPYNYTPGGVSVLMDRPGQTSPKTVTDSGYSEIFTPKSPLAQYCIASTIADSYGTVYYKNDSCYMMAITSKILSIKVVQKPAKLTYNDESFDPTGMKVVAVLANGLERDITNYVTWPEDKIPSDQETVTLTYTYGFDSENYGLKTQTTEVELTSTPKQDADGYYLISSASKLIWFRDQVNSGNAAIKGRMTADIDLSSVESWSPIGTKSKPFAGSFDGGNFTVSNMNVTFAATSGSDAPYLGLFGYVKGTASQNAEIKNLNVTGKVDITANYRNTYAYSGGVAGYVEYTNFTDVSSSVNVTVTYGSVTRGWWSVGGFCGMAKNAKYLRCYNHGDVTAPGYYITGFCGKSEYVSYTSCGNTGAITGSDYTAGFGSETKATTLVDCYNTGSISLVTYGGKYKQQCAAGLVASLRYGSTITRCYNTGSVHGEVYVGGLVGTLASASDYNSGANYVVDSYNSGAISGHSDKSYCGIGGLVGNQEGGYSSYNQCYIRNCYNVGTVTDLGTKEKGNPGAVVGYMNSDYSEDSFISMVDLYYLSCGLEAVGTVGYSTVKNPDQLIEMNEDAMKSADFVTTLGESFKADGTCMQKVNGGYPILVWQKLGEGQSEHTLTAKETVAPTCTEQGYTVYLCSVCGEQVKADFIPALGHTFTEKTVTATCTEDGYTEHTCSVCGYNYRDGYVKAKGHSYTDVVTAATCESAGYTTHTCSVCGYSYVDTMVPAKGHSYTDVVTPATCEQGGYTTHTCTVCGKTYVDAMTEALGHDYKAVVTEPTCDEMGYTTHTCTVCGKSYVDSYTQPAGHSYTSEVTKEPTCKEEGIRTFTCSHCDKSYTEPIAKTAHSYEAVVTEPDCTHMGYTTYTCTVCSDSYKADFVDAKGHECEAAVVEATCEGYGYTVNRCKHCDYSYISEIRQPLGHDYALTGAKEATCTEAGYTGDMVCTRCGDVKTKGEETAALGHDFGQWETVKEADCFHTGLEERKCSRCEEIEQRETTATSCPSDGFRDLNKNSWYHEAVDYALRNDLMNGVSGDRFDPKGATTRAMLVTVLYRLAGEPDVSGLENPFSDVPEGRWFTNAVIWAANEGIVKGVGGTTFNPKGVLTREQAATMLYRYAEAKGYDVTARADLSGYADAEKLGASAREAMSWAVAVGLVNGRSAATLAPKAGTNRAELAALLFRFAENVHPAQ